MAEWCTDSALTALAQLPGVGPMRLDRLLRGGEPTEVVMRLERGWVPDDLREIDDAPAWSTWLEAADPSALREELHGLGIVITTERDPSHPACLRNDLDPSPVLFRRGRAFDERRPAVAIVGTRRSTGLGREVARELGYGLAAAGVTVVSGLALGIDGAAHAGAVAAGGAPPVAFVGGGPDVVYPRRHGALWSEVIAAGTLASEAPPGAAPAPWRFPARNRLIAAFADLVVVVESRAAGGSLLTVDEAIRRDRPVMAVPGSVRNPAAKGTNQLLADGCAPVLSVDDVVMALGLTTTVPAAPAGERLPDVPAHLQVIFEAIDDGPTSVDEITERSGRPVLEVVTGLSELVAGGWLLDDGARVRRAVACVPLEGHATIDRARGGGATTCRG